MKNQNKGILFALLTATISGISIFYSKIAVIKIDSLVLTTSRNLWVGILFVLLFIIRNKINELASLRVKELYKLVLVGLIGGALPFYLFFTGLQFTHSLTANFIHKTLFVWVSILAAIFLKEKFNIKYLVSFALIFNANLLLAPKSFYFGKGEIMILAATLLWSIENIIAKKTLENVSSELVGLARMGIGSLVLLGLSLYNGKAQVFLSLNVSQIKTILIGGTLLLFYVYCWFKALKYAPVSLVTMILTFSLVVGNLLNGSFSVSKLSNIDIYSSIILSAATIILLANKTIINKITSSFHSLK